MQKSQEFKTYNEIAKKFDVIAMTKQQINTLNNNEQYLVLFHNQKTNKTSNITTKTKPKQPTLRQLILNLSDRLDKIEQRIDRIEQKLEQHEQLFRQHGWIK